MLFSVFTPTYNRAELISRVFDSLCAQTFRDFEWVIIDDGSIDDTARVIKAMRDKADFPIIYKARENRGKVQSVNEGLDMARGELFICFDSDDWCTSDALERIAEVWNGLPAEHRDRYSGISCLKKYTNGQIVGEDYSRMKIYGDSYIDRFNRRIIGDKWEILRTDLHRASRYDVHADEKYMSPEYAWLMIGQLHDTIFLNEALSIVEYQNDGISRNNLRHRLSSPVSMTRFYYLAWQVSRPWKMKIRSAMNYARFSFHAGIKSDLPWMTRYLTALPGWLFHRLDIARNRSRSRF